MPGLWLSRLAGPPEPALLRQDLPAFVAHALRTIVGQQQRTIEVGEVRQPGDDVGWSDAERRAQHVTHHQPKTTPARTRCERKRRGQSAALVELDVDHLIATVDPPQLTRIEAGFIRAQ